MEDEQFLKVMSVRNRKNGEKNSPHRTEMYLALQLIPLLFTEASLDLVSMEGQPILRKGKLHKNWKSVATE